MKLFYEKGHPNGFKIYLAAKLKNINLETITSVKGIKNGAELQVSDSNFSMKIDCNSAVLKLMNKNHSEEIVQWLDWELILQEKLIPYLQFLSSGKDDKALSVDVVLRLKTLNSFVTTPPKFLLQELTAADVVLYGALCPLLSSPKSQYIFEELQELHNYLLFLRGQSSFKEAEAEYFGNQGISLEHWAVNQNPIPSENYFTWGLLKGQESCKPSSAVPVASSSSPTNEERTASEAEICEAKNGWEKSPECMLGDNERSKTAPILPRKGERNVMVTSALPYVNNVPHLGNIIGCVLSADCFARFCRIRGDNIIFICGTDEYGTATETKALAEGMTPQEICDKYHAIHAEAYKWFNIEFNYFGRTTTSSQTKAAQSIFWDLYKHEKITQNTVEQLYCSKCERFLADRFVEGICPFPGCGYEDARGDQCDACGKLVNATDLIKPRCKLCSTMPSLKGSTHLFLDLPTIEDELKKWLKETSSQWTANAKVICESWVRDGLKERCITRDLKWGTPVPLEGFKSKVFYVWYDAPIGYISMTMEYCDQWQLWWKDPENVLYYQFMAKDNVPFHGVIFPSCQLGTKDKWTKVTHLIATEYLNYEEGKFSKSRGVGVFGDQAKETGIASDVWRFYLLYVRPEAHDTAFSWTDLQTKNNSELLNNLGNFVNRSLKFVYQFYGGVIPEASPTEADFKILAFVNQEINKYSTALSSCKLRDGIRYILSITRIGNQYIQEHEPYKLIKPDRSEADKLRGATVIHISANIVGLIAILLQPYMPETSKVILNFLNNPAALTRLPSCIAQFMKSGHKINEPSPLIRKITDEEIETLRKKFAGSPPEGKVKPKKSTVHSSNNEAASGNTTPADPAEAQRLEALISEQGLKVRELKSQGASKESLGPEIETLLQLKEKLAVAQGLDPAVVRSGGKKNKKK